MKRILIFILVAAFCAVPAQGTSLYLDGINGKVDCGNPLYGLSSDSSLTVQCFFKPDENEWGRIWSYFPITTDGSFALQLTLSASNILAWNVGKSEGGAPPRADVYSSALTIGPWYHIVATYDQGNLELILNGDSQGTALYSGPFAAAPVDGKLCIGYISHHDSTERASGHYDEFAIWDRVLTEQEIFDLRDRQHSPLDIPDLIGYWPINEGAGDTVYDNSINSNDGFITDGIWATESPCPPTPLPFIDNFDSPELDSCWYWIREDPTHWSLTERPGSMRINTQSYSDFSRPNILLRRVSDENLAIECRLEIDSEPNNNALLEVYQDDYNSLNIVWSANGIIRAHSWTDGVASYADLEETWNPSFLRIEKVGSLYVAKASPDGVEWQFIQGWTRDLTVDSELMVGINATIWPSGNSTPADFDYFSVTELPGTTVCGNVSGVWDESGSPYYVTCDITLPADSTLEIGPGVTVEFMGPYKFEVFGNLQAIGTETDSIYFTTDTLMNPDRWRGFYFGTGSDNSHFSNCIFRFGNKPDPTPVWPPTHANSGGALSCASASPAFEHSTFQYNNAGMCGGAIYSDLHSSPSFLHCLIEHNHGGSHGGGIYVEHVTPLIGTASPAFELCVIRANQSSDLGGGLMLDGQSGTTVRNCLITGNESLNGGGGIWISDSAAVLDHCTITANSSINSSGGIHCYWILPSVMNNLIIWGNTGVGPQACGPYTYSDIEGGLAGIGNIDEYPQFADTANGDYHLTSNSPCIDAGDPSSPFDPDGTVADMGAFPYYHDLILEYPNGNEEWGVFHEDTVRWAASDSVTGLLRIELNRNYPDGDWELLVDNTDNDGWEPITLNDPLSVSCRVMIRTLDSTFVDVSNADFSIIASDGYLALSHTAEPETPVLSWDAEVVECPATNSNVYYLKNFGSQTLVVLDQILDDGTDFSFSHDCPGVFGLSHGEISSCSLVVTYEPQSEGLHLDTIRIQTDAINAVDGYVSIPLSGEQIRTPAAPEIVLTTEGISARLSWDPISVSIGDCPVSITGYLVFFSEVYEGPYWFHGGTTDTTYLQPWVVQNADGMFYHVTTTQASSALMMTLPQDPGTMTREQVLERLR